MSTTQAKQIMERAGHTVDTMHVAVGNIYRCDVLDGWSWMYERIFIEKVKQYREGTK